MSDLALQTRAAIAQITDPSISQQSVDLDNCDREPIHIPGLIQPHGVLLVLSEADWSIVQVSQNSEALLGRSPEVLLGQSLEAVIGETYVQQVKSCLDHEFDAVNPIQMVLPLDRWGDLPGNVPESGPENKPTNSEALRSFSGIVHRSDEWIILELETAVEDEGTDDDRKGEATPPAVGFFDFYRWVKAPVTRLQRTQRLEDLCQVAVEEIQKITGFDRVMVYRFDEDGAGSVVAEVKPDDAPAYLGLRYPDTDIPKQAKYLYLLNLLRLIPDVSYTPVPLVPAHPHSVERKPKPQSSLNDEGSSSSPPSQRRVRGGEFSEQSERDRPLDLSLSTLRSVSPLHLEYLANMGVQASMSISLVHNQQLWGLIACHNLTPQRLSYERRTVCEFLGQTIGLELAPRLEREDADDKIKVARLQQEFVEALTHRPTLGEGIMEDGDRLLALTGASGVAYCEDDAIALIGNTPSKTQVSELVSWLQPKFGPEMLYQTPCLSQHYPKGEAIRQTASGVLALAISQAQRIYLVWFRPEVSQTITWAGKPEKKVELSETGEVRMSPRQSFEQWEEQVQQTALPWKSWEQDAAMELRSAIVGLVFKKANELAQLNSELERSNVELDSFAYVASHDLKEPLRGIHNYSSFLIEDYGDQLDDAGTHKLQKLMSLTQRMEDLINSLLFYSRLGRADLQIHPVDLGELVEGVLDMLRMSKPEAVTVEIPRSLPVVKCDRTQILELYTNLITNAIKYNDKAEKRVEIGYLTQEEWADRESLERETLSRTSLAEVAQAEGGRLPLGTAATVFYVQDNGIGIRPKHLDAIFRIFKRLHPPGRYGGGTGAGLTIVRKIIERHSGSVWVDSIYGEGSTFYFTIEPTGIEVTND